VYTARRFAGPDFLLVGDAGAAVDPLSSIGIKKACASAWVAAVAVHTCLARPAMAEAALELYAARETQVYESYLELTARYCREAAAAHPGPYWAARAAVQTDPALWQDDEETLKHDPAVLGAFSELKAADFIRLEVQPRVRIEPRAAIEGREVVLADTVIAPGAPCGLRILGGVHLPKLLRIAGEHREVPDLFDAYNRCAPPVDLPSFLGALSVLLAKRIVRNADAATR
jgi:hypothetical protein